MGEHRKSRRMLQIPENTAIYKFLYEEHNGENIKWELLDLLIKNRDKTRGTKVLNILSNAFSEIEELCSDIPDIKIKVAMTKKLFLNQFVGISVENGTDEIAERQKMTDSFFEELKKL